MIRKKNQPQTNADERKRAGVAARWVIAAVSAAFVFGGVAAHGQTTADLDAGYRDMYDLRFDDAHRVFADYERAHPADPLGPVSDAAAYLFAEFDRLHILEVELFTDDNRFESREKPSPDPNTKASFDRELDRGQKLAEAALAKNGSDANALFAKIMVQGLRGDYVALVEKRDMAGLSYMKSGRAMAERLLATNPSYYDAYLAIGVENYLLSLKPAPVRWFLRITGAQTDKDSGLAKLKITAEKGHYLLPYARLLLAVAALREKKPEQAKQILEELSREFPHNRLYAKELATLE